MINRKKGAEESNVIIFIILALIVGALVIYFSWTFFSKGTQIIETTDIAFTIAVGGCKADVQVDPNLYCTSPKEVTIEGGGKMIVSCKFIDEHIANNSVFEVGEEKPGCNDDNFGRTRCNLMNQTGVKDYGKKVVNGQKCSEILK